MTRRKNVKRIDPRYFLHEQGLPADIAQQLDQIVMSATSALRKVLESGALSASKGPEARAASGLRDEEAPRSAAGDRLESLISQYVGRLEESAALQLGRGGSRQRGGDPAATICSEVLDGLPQCPREPGFEINALNPQRVKTHDPGGPCAVLRKAVGYLACLEQGDGGPWLKENGLHITNQQIYGSLNDVLRNQFQ
jgi:hypothetical protein